MTRILMLANLKGGNAKTTLCVHLAAALSGYGQHVLVVDLDPQGSATCLSGIDPCNNTAARISLEHCAQGDFARCIRPSKLGYDIFPAYYASGVLAEMLDALLPDHPVCAQYDYVLLDMPPSNSALLARLAPYAGVIIPAMLTFHGMEGLAHTVAFLAFLAEAGHAVRFAGIVPTGVNREDAHARRAYMELVELFPESCILQGIEEDSSLADAVWIKALAPPASRAAQAYRMLAAQLLHRAQDMETEGAHTDDIFFSAVPSWLDSLKDALNRNSLADRIRIYCTAQYGPPGGEKGSSKACRRVGVRAREKGRRPRACVHVPRSRRAPMPATLTLEGLLASLPDFAFAGEGTMLHAAQSCEQQARASALFLYMLASQLCPTAAVYANLGALLADMGNLEEALVWTEKGCALFDDPDLRENREILRSMNGV